MIIPESTTFKNGGYTASLSFCAPFPLDFWGIYVIGILVQGESKVELVRAMLSRSREWALVQMECKPNAEPSWLERLFAWVREKC